MSCFIIKLHGDTIGNIQSYDYQHAFTWADSVYGELGEVTIVQVEDSAYRAEHDLRFTKVDPEWIG